MSRKRKHPYLPETVPPKLERDPRDTERAAEGDATEGGNGLRLKKPKPDADQPEGPTSQGEPRPSRFHMPG